MDISSLITALWVIFCMSTLREANCQDVTPQEEDWDKSKYMEEASQTFKLIFHKYNANVRPPLPVVEINMEVTLRHLHHLDVDKQELQTVLDVQAAWNDTRLTWFPRRIHNIIVKAEEIWLPDIVYTNVVLPSEALFPQSVRVSSKGEIVWTKKQMVTTFCDTDKEDKRQYCTIDLGFSSAMDDRKFANTSTLVLPEDFSDTEWRVVEAGMSLGGDENTTDASTMSIDLVLEARGGRRAGGGGDGGGGGAGRGGGGGGMNGDERTTDLSASSSSETDQSNGDCCQTDSLQGNNSGNTGTRHDVISPAALLLANLFVVMATRTMMGYFSRR